MKCLLTHFLSMLLLLDICCWPLGNYEARWGEENSRLSRYYLKTQCSSIEFTECYHQSLNVHTADLRIYSILLQEKMCSKNVDSNKKRNNSSLMMNRGFEWMLKIKSFGWNCWIKVSFPDLLRSVSLCPRGSPCKCKTLLPLIDCNPPFHLSKHGNESLTCLIQLSCSLIAHCQAFWGFFLNYIWELVWDFFFFHSPFLIPLAV